MAVSGRGAHRGVTLTKVCFGIPLCLCAHGSQLAADFLWALQGRCRAVRSHVGSNCERYQKKSLRRHGGPCLALILRCYPSIVPEDLNGWRWTLAVAADPARRPVRWRYCRWLGCSSSRC